MSGHVPGRLPESTIKGFARGGANSGTHMDVDGLPDGWKMVGREESAHQRPVRHEGASHGVAPSSHDSPQPGSANSLPERDSNGRFQIGIVQVRRWRHGWGVVSMVLRVRKHFSTRAKARACSKQINRAWGR